MIETIFSKTIANCEIMKQLTNHFQYNYCENRLWVREEENILLEISETEQFTTQFNGQGFNLDNGTWIVFNIHSERIKAFYKKTLSDGDIIYYQKWLPREEITQWEFSYLDIVEKRGNKWEFRNK